MQTNGHSLACYTGDGPFAKFAKTSKIAPNSLEIRKTTTMSSLQQNWQLRICRFPCRAVCRQTRKLGVCPKLSRENEYASCNDDCLLDSDCDGEQKCCFNGCGRSCLKVVGDPGLDLEEQQEVVQAVDPDSPNIQVIFRPSIHQSELG